MEINEILKNEFGKKEATILKRMQTGMRCETYLIEVDGKKLIFQLYKENTIYQAKKKYDILKMITNKHIPKAYKYYESESYSFLITEYFEGISLANLLNNVDVNLDEVFNELSKTLSSIHSIQNNVFGWITNNSIINNNRFIEYINSEYNRLVPNIEQLKEGIRNNILDSVNKAIEIIDTKTKDIEKSCLCWYDINPDNILVEENGDRYMLKGLIDPGGARYGIREWDLAFIKMEMCRNEKDFNTFLKCYKRNSSSYLDMELLKSLSVIVELDDISIRIVDKIKLPIPYDSNFKDEIRFIENM